ncbi:hypothetical protein TNCV_3417561 [Trichonephila clavipes]|nr:hypothetical protein TNCV_3417561 [Trichonephila clavipes]
MTDPVICRPPNWVTTTYTPLTKDYAEMLAEQEFYYVKKSRHAAVIWSSAMMEKRPDDFWLLSGVIHSNPSQKSRTVLSYHATIQLAYDLPKFWEIESLPDITPTHSFEELYTKTVSRTQSGRYMVDLPFKEVPNLGDSETNAF